MIDPSVKVFQTIVKDMELENERIKKATMAGLKITGYRHMRKLRTEVNQNKLGLEPLKPYRNPYKDRRYKHSRVMPPLKSLAKGVRYAADPKGRFVHFGFLEGDDTRTPRLTELARKHLTGFRIMVSDEQKKYLHRIGIHMKKRTRESIVPERDIVGRYMARHKAEMDNDLYENIHAKLYGLQI